MPAERTDLTHVNLPQARFKFPENKCRLAHGWVYLPSVTNVETERGPGESLKNHFEFGHCPTQEFSLIHVFDTQPFLKSLPERPVGDHVWMNDNGPSSREESGEVIGYLSFGK